MKYYRLFALAIVLVSSPSSSSPSGGDTRKGCLHCLPGQWG